MATPYSGEEKGLQIWLSYSQAGPGRKAQQGQVEISRNHVQTFFLGSVFMVQDFSLISPLEIYVTSDNRETHTDRLRDLANLVD